jgi:site-specific recombinase XerC
MAASAILKLNDKTNWALFVGQEATRSSSPGPTKDGHAAGVRCGFPKRCHPHLFRDTFDVELLLAGAPSIKYRKS